MRNKRITFAVSEEELKEMKERAKRSGMSLSRYIRIMALDIPRSIQIRDPVKEEMLYQSFSKSVDERISFDESGTMAIS